MTQERRQQGGCPLAVGQVVRSKAGHDKGAVLLVWEIVDSRHVLVVDGGRRPVERPKKKRVIHLQPYHDRLETVESMKQDRDCQNARIRKLLIPYQGREEESECHQKT